MSSSGGSNLLAVGGVGSGTGTSTTPGLPSGSTAARTILFAQVMTVSTETHSCATAGWTKIGQWSSNTTTMSLWSAPPGSAAPVVTWASSVVFRSRTSLYDANAGEPSSTITNIVPNVSNTGGPVSHPGITSTKQSSSALWFISRSSGASGLSMDNGFYAAYMSNGPGVLLGTRPLPEPVTTGTTTTLLGNNTVEQVTVMLELETQDGDPGITVSKMSSNAWMEPPDGLTVSKMSSNAWLDPVAAPPRRYPMLGTI